MGTISVLKLALVAATMTVAGLGTASAGPEFMPTGGITTQPVGHYELCQRLPAECGQTTARATRVELTRKMWATIIEVNNAVNSAVEPRTDLEMWGIEEYWSYPTDGEGDCEDYVLEKRRQLMQLGVPAGSLLITVVRQPNGSGHAVLTVKTSLGDFILDNMEPRVLAWHDTDYQYLKRQSDRHSGRWVAINDDRQVLVGSIR